MGFIAKNNQSASKFHFSLHCVSRLVAHTCQCLSEFSKHEATRPLNGIPFPLRWPTAFYLACTLGLFGSLIDIFILAVGVILCFFSDGVGRSGCVATIMSVIERVKIEQTVDVFQTIKLIRAKRPGAVNTLVSCPEITKDTGTVFISRLFLCLNLKPYLLFVFRISTRSVTRQS